MAMKFPNIPFTYIRRQTLSIPGTSRALAQIRKMITAGLTRHGESGAAYSFIEPLGTPARQNVWLVRKDGQQQFIAKGPSSGDDKLSGWPAFQHELKMQRLFKEDKMIRKMMDFIPSSDTDDPMMILAPFEKTLWEARCTRPMTTTEIKWIMEGVLLGIGTFHTRRLVYTDLKMENVGISGFDDEKPNENVREIIVRIADCGTVSEPGTRRISSLTYRSPEVYFGKPWDCTTDIWSWGVILAQLLLAQVDFKSNGMLDAISKGDYDDKVKVAREKLTADFDLYSVPLYTEKDSAHLLPSKRPGPDDTFLWADEMLDKGMKREDVFFLYDILDPRPDTRPLGPAIMDSGYLKIPLMSDPLGQ
ncbi:kinase-like domain-containing protein [Nemania sp. FL0916]|nr:kinase-like domain-containing protein [Nemania sp. FL0916]